MANKIQLLSSHEFPLLAPIRPVTVVILLFDDSVDQDGYGKHIYADCTPDFPAKGDHAQ